MGLVRTTSTGDSGGDETTTTTTISPNLAPPRRRRRRHHHHKPATSAADGAHHNFNDENDSVVVAASRPQEEQEEKGAAGAAAAAATTTSPDEEKKGADDLTEEAEEEDDTIQLKRKEQAIGKLLDQYGSSSTLLDLRTARGTKTKRQSTNTTTTAATTASSVGLEKEQLQHLVKQQYATKSSSSSSITMSGLLEGGGGGFAVEDPAGSSSAHSSSLVGRINAALGSGNAQDISNASNHRRVGRSPTPPHTQRGAYYGVPGEALRPAPAFTPANLLSLSLTSPAPPPPATFLAHYDDESSPSPRARHNDEFQDEHHRDHTTSSNDDDGNLVEAHAVTYSKEFISGEATEVDSEQHQQSSHFQRRKSLSSLATITKKNYVRYSVLGIFAGVVLLVVGLVVVVTTTTTTTTTTTPDENNTASPYNTTTTTTTTTTAPTSTTSFSSSASLRTMIMEELPDYSIESLMDPFSPQSIAMDWLLYHPNITNILAIDPSWRIQQLFALATIYYAFDGPRWPLGLNNDWLDYESHECDWYSNLLGAFAEDGTNSFAYLPDKTSDGSAVCNSEGQYVTISMGSAATFGYSQTNITFPSEFGLLPWLEDLRLDRNGFLGVKGRELFPPSFYQLTNLQHFNLRNNQLNTALPSQLGLLTGLTKLKFQNNNFTSTIPTQIGKLVNLVGIDLEHNQLTGNLPSQLGQLSKLQRLIVDHNNLEGNLPSQLIALTNVKRLYLQSNNFSGPIPSFGSFSSSPGGDDDDDDDDDQQSNPQQEDLELSKLRLEDNPHLSGTIPRVLCTLQIPGCVYDNPFTSAAANDTTSICELTFDCSEVLCGCDCDCHNTSNRRFRQG